jgi:hypothetical protein
MKKIIENLILSGSNDSKGFSAKKLSIFAVVIAYCICHRFASADNIVMVLTVDAGLITALFGVNVIDKMKNPSDDCKTPNDKMKL